MGSRDHLGMGDTVVKMKIGGDTLDEDVRRIEAVLEVVEDGMHPAVDANGRFDLDAAPYRLRWYEEPGDPLDYQLQAVLSETYSHPLATGENLFSHQDVRNLIRYGGIFAGDPEHPPGREHDQAGDHLLHPEGKGARAGSVGVPSDGSGRGGGNVRGGRGGCVR